MRDYYAVLDISLDATQTQIRRAYQRLARRYSPGVNLWDREAQALFEEISEAYRVLSDPSARTLYDRQGEGAGGTAPVGAGGGTHRGGPRGRRPAPGGRGGGVGRTAAVARVVIPPGMDTGAQLRIPGEGHAGPFGGPRGDLIAITRVRDDPVFTRKGDNLYCELPLTISEAVLGARIPVHTLHGDVDLVIPPGSQSGQVFRIRSRGMPRLPGGGRGGLYRAGRGGEPRRAGPRDP